MSDSNDMMHEDWTLHLSHPNHPHLRFDLKVDVPASAAWNKDELHFVGNMFCVNNGPITDASMAISLDLKRQIPDTTMTVTPTVVQRQVVEDPNKPKIGDVRPSAVPAVPPINKRNQPDDKVVRDNPAETLSWEDCITTIDGFMDMGEVMDLVLRDSTLDDVLATFEQGRAYTMKPNDRFLNLMRGAIVILEQLEERAYPS